ncbi:hypothetical protein [Bacillus sp. B15-48]|uniref:hypothetical protein n=1 Tax=Bacillus sp. B15-48 TaxID=1548601 RepID=UPI00193EE1B6|nr:hypothetical protein [Bacillus sp. B15-48]
MSEILNINGYVADRLEIEKVAEEHYLPIMKMSELLLMMKDHEICCFRGIVNSWAENRANHWFSYGEDSPLRSGVNLCTMVGNLLVKNR